METPDVTDRLVNLWNTPAHALAYLQRADTIPHRAEGEATLLECLPDLLPRVLDLGSGDGRLLALVKLARPSCQAVATDFAETMLTRLHARFASDAAVAIVQHDLNDSLPETWGTFDAIVSSFAIHHVIDDRKRTLYAEVFQRLAPGGAFLNLEHVASPTEALHHQFLAELDVRPEDDDPSNKLTGVETQLGWLRTIGFVDVDCHWKWRELALLSGLKPA
jgi:SAM-dependent methyltransferase